MKQSDWLRSLSKRAGFLHPARSETQLHARCEMQLPALVFRRQKIRSETIFKRKKLPKTFEKRTYPNDSQINGLLIIYCTWGD
jgi:hypothetical protein